MARLTITLPDDVHRQLKLRSASTGESIGRLIERAVEDQKELARLRITELMHRAWAHSERARASTTEEELLDEATELVHEVREEMARGRGSRAR